VRDGLFHRLSGLTNPSLGDMRNCVREICGDEIANECPPLLGTNEEGEMSWFRPLPRQGLWYMIGAAPSSVMIYNAEQVFVGSLSLNRFYSKIVALRTLFSCCCQPFLILRTEIKAMEENILVSRYPHPNEVWRIVK
jgi:hypothetical protein